MYRERLSSMCRERLSSMTQGRLSSMGQQRLSIMLQGRLFSICQGRLFSMCQGRLVGVRKIFQQRLFGMYHGRLYIRETMYYVPGKTSLYQGRLVFIRNVSGKNLLCIGKDYLVCVKRLERYVLGKTICGMDICNGTR